MGGGVEPSNCEFQKNEKNLIFSNCTCALQRPRFGQRKKKQNRTGTVLEVSGVARFHLQGGFRAQRAGVTANRFWHPTLERPAIK